MARLEWFGSLLSRGSGLLPLCWDSSLLKGRICGEIAYSNLNVLGSSDLSKENGTRKLRFRQLVLNDKMQIRKIAPLD